jgi:sialate O-acetylesterase
MSAGGPHKMLIQAKNKIELHDILIGDVWVLTGQSNMARQYKSYKWLMEELPHMEINDNIRWFKIANNTAADKPTKEVAIDPAFDQSWQYSSRKLLPSFSPAGYFFGQERYKQNGVPLGLVYAARGATRAESWVPMDVLKSRQGYARILDSSWNKNYKLAKGQPNVKRPTALITRRFILLCLLRSKGSCGIREKAIAVMRRLTEAYSPT